MISEIKRKSLPAIARTVGLEGEQSLHHFLTNSPWDVEAVRQQRIELIKLALKEREIILCIDDLQSQIFKGADTRKQVTSSLDKLERQFRQHQWWNEGRGWKNILNNLCLIIQPVIFFHLITPWLKVFRIPMLKQGFFHLIKIMNKFNAYVPDG